MVLVLAASACGANRPDDRPSAVALGNGAYAGGLTANPSTTECVGTLIRDAGLRTDTLEHIANGDLAQGIRTWSIGEDESATFEHDVERKMVKECHAEPFPGIDNWPDDPARS